MRRCVLPALAALALAGGGCGGHDEARMRLTTPPEHKGAEPLPAIRAQQRRALRAARIRATRADARRLRPLLRRWARALRRNDDDGAAALFALPLIVSRGVAVRLDTAAQVRAFNASLPCGARLLAVGHQGRYVVATFRLTRRPDHICGTPGRRLRVAVVTRRGKIAEWRQVPDVPGAPVGPDAPEDAPPRAPELVS